jgi:hypothetical protein
MPSLDWQAVLERECDQSQSNNHPYILVDRPDIYRHGIPPSAELWVNVREGSHAKADLALICLNREFAAAYTERLTGSIIRAETASGYSVMWMKPLACIRVP